MVKLLSFRPVPTTSGSSIRQIAPQQDFLHIYLQPQAEQPLQLVDQLVSHLMRNLVPVIPGVGILAKFRKGIWKEGNVMEILKRMITSHLTLLLWSIIGTQE